MPCVISIQILVCLHMPTAKSRKHRGMFEVHNPDKYNDKFGKGLVLTSRTYASPKWAGPGVRRRKRTTVWMPHPSQIFFLWVMWSFYFPLGKYYVQFDLVYQQIVGIPMGTNCAPLRADLFLYCYERDFMSNLKKYKRFDLRDKFNDTSRYLDDNLYSAFNTLHLLNLSPIYIPANFSWIKQILRTRKHLSWI